MDLQSSREIIVEIDLYILFLGRAFLAIRNAV
jgi:hypothetical protein